MAHFVLNDGILFSLNFLIDLLLIIRIRKGLAKKKKIILRNKETSKQNKSKEKLDGCTEFLYVILQVQ